MFTAKGRKKLARRRISTGLAADVCSIDPNPAPHQIHCAR